MTETVFTPELTDEQYQLEIAAMMAQIQNSNEESVRRGAEIELLKTQSRALMVDIDAALRRWESRDTN